MKTQKKGAVKIVDKSELIHDFNTEEEMMRVRASICVVVLLLMRASS
jgi:hypothetical protein